MSRLETRGDRGRSSDPTMLRPEAPVVAPLGTSLARSSVPQSEEPSKSRLRPRVMSPSPQWLRQVPAALRQGRVEVFENI